MKTPSTLGRQRLTRLLALSVLAFATPGSLCLAQTNAKAALATARPETPHLEFVTEYIRELAALERIRAAGEEENNQNTKDDKLPFAGIIHTSTLFDLELGSQVKMLKGMRLNAPFDALIPNITGFYERKIALWRRLREISSAFIVPNERADYSKLAAEMPEIRGELDFIDQALFEASPSVFGTLIDIRKADSKGHASHLTITKEEKAGLISNLDNSFGAKLDQKVQNYTVSAAIILKAYLNKDFKCSDEPWD